MKVSRVAPDARSIADIELVFVEIDMSFLLVEIQRPMLSLKTCRKAQLLRLMR